MTNHFSLVVDESSRRDKKEKHQMGEQSGKKIEEKKSIHVSTHAHTHTRIQIYIKFSLGMDEQSKANSTQKCSELDLSVTV